MSNIVLPIIEASSETHYLTIGQVLDNLSPSFMSSSNFRRKNQSIIHDTSDYGYFVTFTEGNKIYVRLSSKVVV